MWVLVEQAADLDATHLFCVYTEFNWVVWFKFGLRKQVLTLKFMTSM